jgi:hypothetical protein
MDIWSEIKQLEGKELETLLQGKKFEVVEVRDSCLIIKPRVRNRIIRVPREGIESAYQELTQKGQISRIRIMAEHAHWFPAHVAAILVNLPDVTYATKPIIVLYYKK